MMTDKRPGTPIEHPPTKRQKTQTSDPDLKGKSKLINEEHESMAHCGICLLKEGVSLRGHINSCDHYFCYVCIMEWAKVESKCPVCKRRFSSITRPTKEGVFPEERVINVPVRDQVHNGIDNATVGPPDPYAQIKCSDCNLSTDDSFLLLCDLCDSAAHTYCVGLGHTVPKDEWFCKDCTLSKDVHNELETATTSSSNTVILLCDLCDTYCVGPCHTVPEDGWICEDCTLSRDEHAKVESATTSDTNNNNDNNPSSSNTVVLVCDLCDSGAHTYYVGPGHTVPDGWFCKDCTLSPLFGTTNAPNASTLEPQTPSVLASSLPTPVNQSESRAEQSNTQSLLFRTANAPHASTLEPQTPSVLAPSIPTPVNQSESRAEQSNIQSPVFHTTNAPNAQRSCNVQSRTEEPCSVLNFLFNIWKWE